MESEIAHVRRVEPLASNWRTVCWSAGIFDTARRPDIANVEGTIRTPHHLLLVNVRGGAERLEVRTDCGHRYDGPDGPGAVSFVPAHCERRLRLRRVRSEWATLSLRPELLASVGAGQMDCTARHIEIAAFTNIEDRFLSGALTELLRLLDTDGALDPSYCEALSLALSHYLARRFGVAAPAATVAPMKLAPWQIRRIADFVESKIGEPIRIADLAVQVGVSIGHFHRAFRATTGRTPLAYINAARVHRAASLLATEDLSVAALALRVGFLSPSYFMRVFRQIIGTSPSVLRKK
jgi:AraC family transcriptional regulator